MTSALGVEPDFSLEELLRVNNSDQWSVQFSPALTGPGGAIGGTIVRSAAPWKGDKKMESESLSQYVNRLEETYGSDSIANSVRAVQDFQSGMSLSGETGVALVRVEGGDLKPVPAPGAALMEKAGTGEIESTHPNYDAALEALGTKTGQQPRFPSVY